MFKSLYVWFMGLWESRSDCTWNPGDDWIETYDKGRALGRRILHLD